MPSSLLNLGQLTSDESSLYKTGSNKTATFTSLKIVNKSSVARPVEIFIKSGSVKVTLEKFSLPAGYSAEIFDVPKVISKGEELLASGGIGALVDFVLFGEVE